MDFNYYLIAWGVQFPLKNPIKPFTFDYVGGVNAKFVFVILDRPLLLIKIYKFYISIPGTPAERVV